MADYYHTGIKIPKYVLKVTGLWPKQTSTIWTRIRMTIIVSITVFFTVTLALEVYHLSHNYEVLTEHLTIVIPPTSFFIKLMIFIQKNGKLRITYRMLNQDVFNNYPEHFSKILRKSTRTNVIIAVTYQLICFIVIVIFCLLPTFTTANLPVRFSYELGHYSYILMYIFQVIGLNNAGIINSCLDTLAVALMGIASSQIDILNYKITNFKVKCDSMNGEDSEKYITYLNQCVKHHNEIIKFVEGIEDVFSLIFLVQYLASGAEICNIGLQLVHNNPLSTKFTHMILFFVAMMAQLGLYCWYGNEIILKSEATRNACYDSDWTNCNLKVRKILIIIMERSKRPLFLTAGKLSLLSLTSFTSVINTSYSYFALMQRLYSKTQN